MRLGRLLLLLMIIARIAWVDIVIVSDCIDVLCVSYRRLIITSWCDTEVIHICINKQLNSGLLSTQVLLSHL